MVVSVKTNEDTIKKLLLSTRRDNIYALVQFLDKRGFFRCPASTRFHGAHNGGLANHSLQLYLYFLQICRNHGLNIPHDSIIITSLLHDLCKVDLYVGDDKPYQYNNFVGNRGHGKLSVERIERFIKLTDLEKEMITFHMGIYTSDATIDEVKKAFNDIRVKMFYFADEMVTHLVEKDNEEVIE